MQVAALIPIKSFRAAKGRLTNVLGAQDRQRLAQWMAAGVLAAVAEFPTFVACDDDEVAEWTTRRGARPIWAAGLGLNGAVDDGVAQITQLGFDHVIVAHADLPRAERLSSVASAGRVMLVPDRRLDGTNVMSFPTSRPLRAAYGRGSFARHLAQAMGLGDVTVEVRRDPGLSLDLDTATDLDHPMFEEVMPPWVPTSRANLLSS